MGVVKNNPYRYAINRVPIGPGITTALPGVDFETYSDAGYLWDPELNKWKGLPDAPQNKRGIDVISTAVYAEHPSTKVLSLAYTLPENSNDYDATRLTAPILWLPGMRPPTDLFDYIASGGLIAAYYSPFEFYIWLHKCCAVMDWPPLNYRQLRDTMAKARRAALPGKLEKAGEVLALPQQKDKLGKALLDKFSKPRQPTKKDKRRRVMPADDVPAFLQFNLYNGQDCVAEAAVGAAVPDLSADELPVWLLDQKINFRGVHIDRKALNDCLFVARAAIKKYTTELQQITGGVVKTAGECAKIRKVLADYGVHTANLDADTVKEALKRNNLPPPAKRILEIRSIIGAASVKKLFALDRHASHDSRIRDLFAYYGGHTGRWAGKGPQPQNLKASGPKVKQCGNMIGDKECGTVYWAKRNSCPVCGAPEWAASETEWSTLAVETALRDIATRDRVHIEADWGDAIDAICGCLRGLFVAAPGAELICSDFSAVEAVILAILAGEQWRIDIFNTHGLIYEKTASMITGIPFDEIVAHKTNTGIHHKARKPLGKIPELASGFGGGLGAWIKIGALNYMTEDEIRMNVKKWRAASPMIEKFWYGLEGAAHKAVRYPGQVFEFRGIKYFVDEDNRKTRRVLYCQLPSGRLISYWDPELHPDVTLYGRQVWKLTYMGWNSDYKKGPKGWIRLETYGGKLTENVVQAIARDLLANAMLLAEQAGYAIVLHVHDEIVAEVKEGTGSIEELERIMCTLPPWAMGWPIKAAGGWRGRRYRKD